MDIKNLLAFLICLQSVLAARSNTTDLFTKFLGRTAPFKSYSGYKDIDWYMSPADASIYYSYFLSQISSESTPLIFYLAGGKPGMASQFAAFRQFGPYEIKKKGTGYQALQNPWAWNKFGHLVFVDQPIGTGFSINNKAAVGNMTIAAQHLVNFLYNFKNDNVFNLQKNPVYLVGDGFSAQLLPLVKEMVSLNISIGFKIDGIILSNPFISIAQQINTYESFLYSTGMFSGSTCANVRDLSNNVIQMIKNNAKGDQIQTQLNKIWKGNFYNGMDLYNYRQFSRDSEGIDYISMLNQFKANFSVPNNVKYNQNNPNIEMAAAETIFNSYKNDLAAALNDNNLKVLIYGGQNNFMANPAGTLEFLKNVPWKYYRQYRLADKQKWMQSGKLRGWVKKYKNLMNIVLKDTGHYIYQDESFSSGSAWLMLKMYFAWDHKM